MVILEITISSLTVYSKEIKVNIKEIGKGIEIKSG